MNTSAVANAKVYSPESRDQAKSTGGPSVWQRVFGLPLAFTVLFLSFTLLHRVYSQPRLWWTYMGVCAGLMFWQLILFWQVARQGRRLQFEFTPIKSHYVQASMQFCVYAYFGWYWRNVYEQAPLILSQVVFLYLIDMLLCWSRRDVWRLGFGPFPIVFSTNLFMWFRDDWFVFQFLMVAVGALGKEFIRWRRDGKTAHIFNPSAISLSLFSLILILTGTTRFTWGEELALMLGAPPYIYTLIFLVGLVVQYFFSVTLMTLSATVALIGLNLIYTASTGVYQFVDSNIPIAVFLGLHLLMTDPSTSPRSNIGKIIFGGLYGVGVFVLYSLLSQAGVPRFYDKLLAVPLLNLSVRGIDRFARWGLLGRIGQWESRFPPRSLNLFHMSVWVIIFATMVSTGFVQARHPGESIAFWKNACEAGRPRACQNLTVMLNDAVIRGSGEACNELGLMYIEGKFVDRNVAKATDYFTTACERGVVEGCANASIQYLFQGVARSHEEAARSLDSLERDPNTLANGRYCYVLGFAYENGRGRNVDLERARGYYSKGCDAGDLGSCKSFARMSFYGQGGAIEHRDSARALQKACDVGDAESCMYLARMYHAGDGIEQDELRARSLLEKACQLGAQQACAALKNLAQ